MQIRLRKREKKKHIYIYKYILHVFLLGLTPRDVWRSSHVLAGISMFIFIFQSFILVSLVIGCQSVIDVFV